MIHPSGPGPTVRENHPRIVVMEKGTRLIRKICSHTVIRFVKWSREDGKNHSVRGGNLSFGSSSLRAFLLSSEKKIAGKKKETLIG